MENKITLFRGDYNWLSNFQYFDKPMTYGDLKFLTNEHFYIAIKTLDQSLRKEVSEHPAKGLKKFGKTLPIRGDWEEIKIEVMLYGLRYKFSHHNPSLRNKLLNTTDLVVEERNWWGDKFWGTCLKTGEGENHLGKLIMKVREEIKI